MTSITDPRVLQLKRDIELEERSGNHTAARILRERLRALIAPKPQTFLAQALENFCKDVKEGER